MKRQRLTLAATLAGALVLVPLAQFAGAQAPAPAPAPAAKQKWVAPIRGIAEIGYLAPKTKVAGNDITTVIKIKNLSNGSIALLRVDEFWYDKANQPVGGDTYRHKKPLMPGEVIEITLKAVKTPTMFRNQYQFSHANGEIKAKVLQKIE